jgi:phosphohistidine phosphatase
MKTLYIIRHAKSSWSFDLPDIDRPLGVRGRRDVHKVGTYLSRTEPTPDMMITSNASRSLYTALIIADEWSYPEEEIKIAEELYHTDSRTILAFLATLGEANSVAIFSHNPALNEFSKTYIDNLPTCGVCAVYLDIEDWADIKGEKGKVKFLISPKRMPLE